MQKMTDKNLKDGISVIQIHSNPGHLKVICWPIFKDFAYYISIATNWDRDSENTRIFFCPPRDEILLINSAPDVTFYYLLVTSSD